mmetsp:Transcript_29312/g.87676  ORF Transcript_29312/g.87676 Transcript_29312/m.87676 type:complete len:95 (-) Transcript_29312:574-858(-)
MTSLYTAALNQRPPRPSPNDATGFLASSPLLPSTGLRRQSKAVPPNTPLLPPPPPPSEEATPPRAPAPEEFLSPSKNEEASKQPKPLDARRGEA